VTFVATFLFEEWDTAR